jgi:hypothetical protein
MTLRQTNVDAYSAVESVPIRNIFGCAHRDRESVVANKEQKRTSREAKKPKQKKKAADKRPAVKGQTAKP